jgi:thiol-disulfide isomerase/thioredoxin
VSGSDKDPDENDRFLYPVSLGMIVVALVLAIAFLPRVLPHSREAGADAPDFAVPVVANADGLKLADTEPSPKKQFKLSEYHGHPVLLDFWATWCGPCKAQSPIVNRIAARYKDRGLITVGVNTSDEPDSAAPYAKGHGLTFPMAWDKGNEAARVFGVENLPTMVLITKQGKVAAIRTGMTSDDEIDRLVRSAL